MDYLYRHMLGDPNLERGAKLDFFCLNDLILIRLSPCINPPNNWIMQANNTETEMRAADIFSSGGIWLGTGRSMHARTWQNTCYIYSIYIYVGRRTLV